jgi:Fur family transcriptional regulator, ferric uptake regulator
MNLQIDPKTAFLSYLGEHHHRVTSGRFRVFEGALQERGHFDADGLYLKLRARDEKVSRATVYRTLDLLVEAGFLCKMLTENQAVYEVVKGRGHHDHLVCTACGSTLEVFSDALERAQEELCHQHGFLPASHSLRVEGLCAACRKAP